MTSRDFCYWLQGYFEVTSVGPDPLCLNDIQVACIQKHLNLVFKHEIDPSMGDQAHQDELNTIHNKPPKSKHGPKFSPSETLLRC